MSNQFAKIFERDGEQVVMMKSTHDATDAPSLSFTMHIGALRVGTEMTFNNADTGEQSRDAAFDAYTEEGAFDMRSKLEAQFGELGGEEEPAASTPPRKRKPR